MLRKLETAELNKTISSFATVGMGSGTGTSIIGWMTSSQGIALIGIIITISGFLINLFYQNRNDERLRREADFRYTLEIAEEHRQQELHAAQLLALKIEKQDA